jgi:D-tagatose-1,6-bisphosphate aldolase subunit GatZ/KbaZ
VAQRAALLAQEAEKAWRALGDGEAPIYVVGTEVPSPGGEKAGDTIRPTEAAAVAHTLEVVRNAFRALSLESAWERVIALVVHPGVDFSQDSIIDYDREKARELTRQLMAHPGIVYEAHSTDYQTANSLARLVEDHFAVLKVGPWLTFKMREAIFALSEIERDWLGTRRGIRLSDVRGALENTMLKNPEHWAGFYSGDDSARQFARAFGFSDRCRYYWGDATVQSELKHLLQNLSGSAIPLPVLSQFLPVQYEKVRNGSLSSKPRALISDHIASVLRIYRDATTGRRSD